MSHLATVKYTNQDGEVVGGLRNDLLFMYSPKNEHEVEIA